MPETIEASVSSIAKNARVDAKVRVEFGHAVEFDGLEIVISDVTSRREYARAPIGDATELTFATPSGRLAVAITHRDKSAYRAYLLQRIIEVRSGDEFVCEIEPALHSLTVSVPRSAQPVVLEITRPDDPNWSLTRPTRVTHVDATQDVVFEALEIGDYLVIAHRPHSDATEALPVTVFEPTRLVLSDRLR